jgi:putative GTP pyrophosphokinase
MNCVAPRTASNARPSVELELDLDKPLEHESAEYLLARDGRTYRVLRRHGAPRVWSHHAWGQTHVVASRSVSPRRSSLSDIPLPASRTQIDRAGERMRAWWSDLSLPASLLDTDPELRDAAILMTQFRLSFQDPLGRVRMGLQSFVSTEGAPIVVAQRLKRAPTIAGKLVRMPTVRLTQMQDIGGCRAILPSQDHVDRVVRRIRRQGWEIRGIADYASGPKSTGYRAVHVIVDRRGRLVEIQLRTPLQQRWAAEVDRAAGQVGVALKDGAGPPEIAEPFAELAEEMARTGVDAPSGARLDEAFGEIRQKVRTYLAEN